MHVSSGLEVALVSRIDVVHRADGVSITLASHGFSMSVELSPSEADDLVEQLILLQSQAADAGARTGIGRRVPDGPVEAKAGAGC